MTPTLAHAGLALALLGAPSRPASCCGRSPAVALSLAVFVVAHARWGASHLVSVL